MAAYVNNSKFPVNVGVYSALSRLNFRNSWRYVDYIQCDGDELELACRIVGRTDITARVFTFVGQDAQTIVANWT